MYTIQTHIHLNLLEIKYENTVLQLTSPCLRAVWTVCIIDGSYPTTFNMYNSFVGSKLQRANRPLTVAYSMPIV